MSEEQFVFRASGTGFRVAKDAEFADTASFLAATSARGITAKVGQRDEAIGEAVATWVDLLLADERERIARAIEAMDGMSPTRELGGWRSLVSRDEAASIARTPPP